MVWWLVTWSSTLKDFLSAPGANFLPLCLILCHNRKHKPERFHVVCNNTHCSVTHWHTSTGLKHTHTHSRTLSPAVIFSIDNNDSDEFSRDAASHKSAGLTSHSDSCVCVGGGGDYASVDMSTDTLMCSPCQRNVPRPTSIPSHSIDTHYHTHAHGFINQWAFRRNPAIHSVTPSVRLSNLPVELSSCVYTCV